MLPRLVSSKPPLTWHHWYVCLTKPRQELFAVRKLEEQGYQVFLPMLVRWERSKNSGWARKPQVMFPRYAFVRCRRVEQSIAPIRSTPGVSGLVAFGNTPATLDDATLDAIRSLAEQRANGDDGPLKGLCGIVSAVAVERVTVLLSLRGREKPVAIPADSLTLA
ncbi:transcription termination/antitermination NusG family protein [Accumulibacter sp.]|uniref:transcription termination/antitermination protein NusG n=1 Tax=Accumulibacter sp. TaxID=2053492 RepID=UPI00262CCB00|nr:transcription termination/antitermination NusG family protein [Accumulibacter sp.]